MIKLTLVVYSNNYAKLILIRILPAYVKSQFYMEFVALCLFRKLRLHFGQKLDARHTVQPAPPPHKLWDSAVYEAVRLTAAESEKCQVPTVYLKKIAIALK